MNSQESSPSPAPAAASADRQGWVAPMTADEEIRQAVEAAFGYRGDVTLTLRDGRTIEGYIFDRRCDGPALADCSLSILPKDGGAKVTLSYANLVGLAFTGRDTAAGKSFETWMRKHQERKAAGEKNISIEPEALD